jgi:hypothetical protein
VSGEAMSFESSLPADIALVMEALHEETQHRDV